MGGFPGFPPVLADFRVRQERRGIRGRCSALSPGHLRGGVCRVRGEAGGVWGTWNRGRGFPGGGGGSGFPSAFPDWSLLLPVYSQSRAVVFLTSPSLLFEGVRSGTRRRRGASASAQAGGGTGPGTRRAAPARTGAALYSGCAGGVRVLCRAGPPAAVDHAGCWIAAGVIPRCPGTLDHIHGYEHVSRCVWNRLRYPRRLACYLSGRCLRTRLFRVDKSIPPHIHCG